MYLKWVAVDYQKQFSCILSSSIIDGTALSPTLSGTLGVSSLHLQVIMSIRVLAYQHMCAPQHPACFLF